MTEFGKLLRLLSSAKIEFIVVGGVAATGHGSGRVTVDLDVVYRRSDENLHRIISALAAYSPYPRGAPPGLPFKWDERTLRHGLNFTLVTSIGWIDLLGEISGGGSYEELVSSTVEIELFEQNYRCITLEKLIEVKRAAGRPKDFETVAELEIILEEKRKATS
jgi:hypothetical protein